MHKYCFKIALLSVLIAATGVPCPAAGPEFIVVQSADIKPFNEARAGFESTCGCNIADVIITGADRRDIVGIIHRTNPDGVLAIGVDALAKVKNIQNIPLFYTMATAVTGSDQELKNISGINMLIAPEMQVQTIMEVLPAAKRIGVIYDFRHSSYFVERALRYASGHGLEILALQVSESKDVISLLNSLKGRIDVLVMLPDVTVINRENVSGFLQFSFSTGVPIFTFSEKYVEIGAFAAIAVDPFDLGAQAGEIARKAMLRSESRPVHMYARKKILYINLKIAQKLKINIPAAIANKSVLVK